MARRMGAGTIRLERASAIAAVAAVGSRLEQEGPLGAEFDRTVEDSSFGEKSWEKAETKMQQLAMELALQKGQTAPEQVDVVLGGDLLNQCIGLGLCRPGAGEAVFRAVRGVQHHGRKFNFGGAFGGKRRRGEGSGGYLLPLLLQ